jgi:CheY-like chemotaxis protein
MKVKDSIHILLVEDNEGDVMLTKEALEEIKASVHLSVVKDGKQAIDFLNQSGEYIDSTLPDFMLLDINLPKKNGHEVLQYVKGSERLKHIPVIMLTTSSSERDINLTYNNHANCYITKPSDVNDYMEAVSATANFWLNICKLSNQKRDAI